MLTAVGLIFDALLWLAEFLMRGLAGWRYVLSPRYRAATRRRWAGERPSAVAVEVTGAVAGVVLSSMIVVSIYLNFAHR